MLLDWVFNMIRRNVQMCWKIIPTDLLIELGELIVRYVQCFKSKSLKNASKLNFLIWLNGKSTFTSASIFRNLNDGISSFWLFATFNSRNSMNFSNIFTPISQIRLFDKYKMCTWFMISKASTTIRSILFRDKSKSLSQKPHENACAEISMSLLFEMVNLTIVE